MERARSYMILSVLLTLTGAGCTVKQSYLLVNNIPQPANGVLVGRLIVEFSSLDGKQRFPFLGTSSALRKGVLELATIQGGGGLPGGMAHGEAILSKVGRYSSSSYKALNPIRKKILTKAAERGYFVLELPTGIYMPTRLTLDGQPIKKGILMTVSFRLPHTYFGIKPGKVTYIGDILVTVACRNIDETTNPIQVQRLNITNISRMCKRRFKTTNRSRAMMKLLGRIWKGVDFNEANLSIQLYKRL